MHGGDILDPEDQNQAKIIALMKTHNFEKIIICINEYLNLM